MTTAAEERSIADMAATNGHAPEEAPEPSIEGTAQLSMNVGGMRPTVASMKLRGGSIPVEGEFKKGDRLTLVVEVSVDEIHFVDKKDNDGRPVQVERRHISKIAGVRRAEG